MQFCNECGALLVPKKDNTSNKFFLICRKCGNKVSPDSAEIADYVITSDLNHVPREKIEVLKEKTKRGKRVTDEDREAFEDFFEDDSGVEPY
ncbi:MAG: hypothetical protein ACFFD2_09405 [Promethearchaeota archaeon]